jgi:hypothetical protein
MAGQARKDRFLAVLTELGGSAGNGRLRETLQWAEATYNGVKDDLVAEGVVTLGRGRGGSVSLAATGEIVVEAAPPVAAPAKTAPAKAPRANGVGGNLGFEAELFKAADKLRGNMEPSDYMLRMVRYLTRSQRRRSKVHGSPFRKPICSANSRLLRSHYSSGCSPMLTSRKPSPLPAISSSPN